MSDTVFGTIVFVSPTGSFGFIAPDGYRDDNLFFHKSAVSSTSIKGMRRGARVSYTTTPSLTKPNTFNAVQVNIL
jgi:cold shock CspA family protein